MEKQFKGDKLKDLFKESKNWKSKRILTAKEIDNLIEDAI